MNPALVVAIMRRWWFVCLIIMSAAVLGTLGAFIAAKPRYASNVQLFVSSAAPTNSQEAYQGALFVKERVLSYAALARSTRVTAPVVRRFGLKLSPEELSQKMTSTVPTDTTLINLTVNADRPRRARDIATALATGLVELVRQLEGTTKVGAPAVEVQISQSASLASAPSYPRPMLFAGVGLFVGAVVSVAAALLLDRLAVNRQDAKSLRQGASPASLRH